MHLRVLAAVLAFGAALPAIAADGVPLSAERSWQIQRIGPPTITPDGKTVIAPVTSYDMKENKGLTDLWLWSIDGTMQRALTTHPASDSSPLLSPDGRILAFVSQRNGDTAPQVYMLPLAGGEPSRVTNVPTGVAQIKWFPDARRIAFLSRVWADLDDHGEAGRPAEGAHRREEQRADLGRWPDLLLGHLARRPPAARVQRRYRGWRAGEPHRRHRARAAACRGAARFAPVRHLAGRQGTRLRRRHQPGRQRDEPRRLHRGDRRQGRGEPQRGQQGRTTACPLYSPDGRWLAFAQQRIKGFYGDMRAADAASTAASGAVREVVGDDWDRSRRRARLGAATRSASTARSTTRAPVRVYEIPLDGQAAPRSPARRRFAARWPSRPDPGRWSRCARASSSRRPLVRIDPATGSGDEAVARSTTRCSPAPRSARTRA